MKRIVKIVLIVSSVLAAVGILLVIASGVMGGRLSDLWSGRLPVTQFRINGNTVGVPFSSSDSHSYNKSNTYTVSADGIDAVQIDWISGDVTVKIGETDQIVFSETGADLTEKTALRYGVQGSTLAIHYCDDQPFINVALPDKQLTVIVPATLAANLRSLSVGTVSANVTIDDPAFRLEKLDVETVSGNLNAVMDFAGIVELETVSGNLSINGAVNEFEAEAGSGAVLLNCRSGAPGDLDIETVSGNVTLQLPKDVDLTLDYETVSGDFDSVLAMGVHNGNYIIGNGRSKWKVETVSGDLTVK